MIPDDLNSASCRSTWLVTRGFIVLIEVLLPQVDASDDFAVDVVYHDVLVALCHHSPIMLSHGLLQQPIVFVANMVHFDIQSIWTFHLLA